MNGPATSVDISSVYQKIYDVATAHYLPPWDVFLANLSQVLDFIKPVSIVLSLLFLTGIIYSIIRTQAIFREAMAKTHAHTGAAHGAHDTHGAAIGGHSAVPANSSPETSKRWGKIVEHINSSNPSDWRFAILECDIILDEMLTKMNYHGETLSDKLKAVEKSDFLTIDKAWEAHRVRNDIAHEGSNFEISDSEARRVVSLYEEVFKEFHYI